MTLQTLNTFLYENTKFEVDYEKIEINNTFDPVNDPPSAHVIVHSGDPIDFRPYEFFDLGPSEVVSSGCYRANVLEYGIIERYLVVKDLIVWLKEPIPKINGVSPRKLEEGDNYDLGWDDDDCWILYEGINQRLDYSGRMLIGADRIEGMPRWQHYGDYPWGVFGYERVVELVFEQGLFIKQTDHSSLVQLIRKQLEWVKRKEEEEERRVLEEKAWRQSREPETTDQYFRYFLRDLDSLSIIEDSEAQFLDPDWESSAEIVKKKIVDRMKIERFVREREIPYLLHFTNLNNLECILRHGVYPRERLGELPYKTWINDEKRLDGLTRTSSLSIAHPNSPMFYKYRQQQNDEWVVLVISPDVLWQFDCFFSKHNAAMRRNSKLSFVSQTGMDGLIDMFKEIEGSPTRGEQCLKPYDPTDPQAEVLVRGVIPVNKIQGVVFRDKVVKSRFEKNFPGLKTAFHAEGAGFFSIRNHLYRDNDVWQIE